MDTEYIIKRSSKRKKITITVERDQTVIIHAPTSTSEEKLQRIVESKKQWINEKIKHPQKYNKLPHPPGKELVNGESALYLGRQYQIEFVKEGINQILFQHQHFLIPISFAYKGKKVLRDWYIKKAQEELLPRVDFFSKVLGVKSNDKKIVNIHYRWGSCTTQDKINLNWRLIKAPMFVVDYVIIHELAHLLEPNHTVRFWNIVRVQSPKMEIAKKWLLENGQILEEEI